MDRLKCNRLNVAMITLAIWGCFLGCTSGNTKEGSNGSIVTSDSLGGHEPESISFVPCTECEEEGYLVTPISESWTPTEKELYHLTIDFWEQTTGYLFSKEMLDLLQQGRGDSCKARFIDAISGGRSGESEALKWFGLRNRFGPTAIGQFSAGPWCEGLGTPSAKAGAPIDSWEKEAFKCLDVVFWAGAVEAIEIARPLYADGEMPIVKMRLFGEEKVGKERELLSVVCLYFERVDGEWFLAMRRDK